MDAQWLQLQFTQHPDKTKAELARATGLEPSGISKILAGTRQIKANEYVAMRKFFGLPSDGASAVAGPGAYKLGQLDAAKARLGEDDGNEWILPAGVLKTRTQASAEQIKIFQVRESAMEPDFKQGETVLVDLSDKHPSPPGVFVISDGFGYMLRTLAFVPNTKPPEVNMSAKDGTLQTMKIENIQITGRVIAKLQMV